MVYDAHLFQQLAAYTWVFDSSRTDSASHDTAVYAKDTIEQTTTFNSQLYIIRNVVDTTVRDSTVYQVIYNTPDKVYFYPYNEQLIPNQYFIIDTVNTTSLVLSRKDTAAGFSSVMYYHAK